MERWVADAGGTERI
jgi:hypothetical protein